VLIQREWPNTVIITITEQNPVLRIGDLGLVNFKGELFSPSKASLPKTLPTIWGIKDLKPEILSLYYKANEFFDKMDLTIKSLTFYPNHYLKIVLDNDMNIYLKEKDPLEQINLLARLYGKLMTNHEKPPKYIDLRYGTTGLAVKWE
jgi:cell division protein FtsQ